MRVSPSLSIAVSATYGPRTVHLLGEIDGLGHRIFIDTLCQRLYTDRWEFVGGPVNCKNCLAEESRVQQQDIAEETL